MMNSTPDRSPIRIFNPSTAQRMQRKMTLRSDKKKSQSSRKNTSSTTKELRENSRQHRLALALEFIASILDECSRPETESDLASALPDGKLLLIIAQQVCRSCNLNCFDFPKLARVTPSGKSRVRTQNHAQFVSFCNEIGVSSHHIPSLNDVVDKNVTAAVNTILEIKSYFEKNKSSSHSVVHMNMEEYLTPTKKENQQKDNGDAHMLQLSGPSPLVYMLSKENILSPSNERRLHSSIKPVTLKSC
jgi:hypothetical protein